MKPLSAVETVKAVESGKATAESLVRDLEDGELDLDPYVGTLENGGVGIADHHDQQERVGPELAAEVAGLRQQIIDKKEAVEAAQKANDDLSKALAAANYHSVPALQHIHQCVALGPFQARVARGCAASGARWQAALTRLPSWRAVASLTVPFCTIWAM